MSMQGLSLWWAYKGGLSSLLTPHKAIPMALLHLWAFRFHLDIPWHGWLHGLGEEDWRYDDFKAKIKSPALYWAFSFLSFHVTPAALVYAGSLPLCSILSSRGVGDFGVLQAGACLCGLAAIACECVADRQLKRVRACAPSA